MSYILDALARSHTSAPPRTGWRAMSKRTLWGTGAIGLLLAVVMFLGVTYVDTLRMQREKPRAQSVAGPSPARTSVAGQDIPSMAPRPAQHASATVIEPTSPPAVATVRPSDRPHSTAIEPSATVRFSPPIALTQPLPGPSPLGPGGTYVASRSPPAVGVAALAVAREPSRTVPLVELKSLSALPPDVRAAIAQMKVRVLFYAPQPRSRFVMIDGRELREGDELLSGLRLQEITDTGMVLKHKGMLVLSPAITAP